MQADQKPTIPEVLPRFVAYHACNPVWGSLHIVLEDGNCDDSSVRFCLEEAEKRGDAEGAELARILLRMSRSQRGRLDWKVTQAEGLAG